MSSHRYPRTARLNELLHQIIAEEMGVEVEPDLRHATVYVDTPTGDERDEEMLAELNEHRIALQKAIARQARVKRTPLLAFRVDQVERQAARVEEVLRDLHEFGDDDDPDA
jgi:ribosome-binding factor A